FSQWNGVAIVSRVGLEDVETSFAGQPCFAKDPAAEQPIEARAIGATCGGIRVWSLYVPNVRELGDRHKTYKLDWLDDLRDQAAAWPAEDPDAEVRLGADWKVAARDEDVWGPEFFVGKTDESAPAGAAIAASEQTGFVEVTREHRPGLGVYTYWDYT